MHVRFFCCGAGNILCRDLVPTLCRGTYRTKLEPKVKTTGLLCLMGRKYADLTHSDLELILQTSESKLIAAHTQAKVECNSPSSHRLGALHQRDRDQRCGIREDGDWMIGPNSTPQMQCNVIKEQYETRWLLYSRQLLLGEQR